MPNEFDNVADGEPDSIVVGSFIQWRRDDLADYPNTEYDLIYRGRYVGLGDDEFGVDATADGEGFRVAIPSATSAKFNLGQVAWQAFIVRKSDGERIVVNTGRFTVDPDYAASHVDVGTHAEKMVGLIEARLEGRLKSDVDNYSIGNRHITKMSVEELRELRGVYLAEVESEKALEDRKNGKKGGSSIQARFGY